MGHQRLEEPSPLTSNKNATAGLVAAEKDHYKYRPKSTWYLKSLRERNFWELVCGADICMEVYKIRSKDSMPPTPPYQSPWGENLFILKWALPPIILQWMWYKTIGTTWHPAFAYLWYHVSFVAFAFACLHRFHHYMIKYGVFDQDVCPRDKPADADVTRLGFGVFCYSILRTLGPVLIAYIRDEVVVTPWAPIRAGLWICALDTYFYSYHRSAHEIPWLWRIHSKHHKTAHPTPLLAILADDFQEVLEIVIIPLLATMTVSMPFHELYITICYMLYMEALGHSGIRADWQHPLLGPVLNPLGLGITIQDHDIHHRRGRSGRNYSKATLLWDKLFGTIDDRIE